MTYIADLGTQEADLEYCLVGQHFIDTSIFEFRTLTQRVGRDEYDVIGVCCIPCEQASDDPSLALPPVGAEVIRLTLEDLHDLPF